MMTSRRGGGGGGATATPNHGPAAQAQQQQRFQQPATNYQYQTGYQGFGQPNPQYGRGPQGHYQARPVSAAGGAANGQRMAPMGRGGPGGHNQPPPPQQQPQPQHPQQQQAQPQMSAAFLQHANPGHHVYTVQLPHTTPSYIVYAQNGPRGQAPSQNYFQVAAQPFPSGHPGGQIPAYPFQQQNSFAAAYGHNPMYLTPPPQMGGHPGQPPPRPQPTQTPPNQNMMAGPPPTVPLNVHAGLQHGQQQAGMQSAVQQQQQPAVQQPPQPPQQQPQQHVSMPHQPTSTATYKKPRSNALLIINPETNQPIHIEEGVSAATAAAAASATTSSTSSGSKAPSTTDSTPATSATPVASATSGASASAAEPTSAVNEKDSGESKRKADICKEFKASVAERASSDQGSDTTTSTQLHSAEPPTSDSNRTTLGSKASVTEATAATPSSSAKTTSSDSSSSASNNKDTSNGETSSSKSQLIHSVQPAATVVDGGSVSKEPAAKTPTKSSCSSSSTTAPADTGLEPISPTPLPETPVGANRKTDKPSVLPLSSPEDNEAKSKSKGKKNAAKRAEINRKGEKGGEMDAFKDLPSSSTSNTTTSPATPPETVVAPPTTTEEPKVVAAVEEVATPTVKEGSNGPTENHVAEKAESPAVVDATPTLPTAGEAVNHVNNVSAAVSAPADAANPADAKSESPVPNNEHENKDEMSAENSNDDSEASRSSSLIKLKYKYNEEQWSPINIEGKKQYDRDFLIQLQKDPLSMTKPANLPDMDIIKNNAISDRPGKMSTVHPLGKDWMPGFIKSTQSRGGGMNTKRGSRDGGAGGGGGGGSGGGAKRSMNNPPRVVSLSIQEKVELHQTENAWKPEKLRQEDSSSQDEQDTLAELERRSRGFLNKLTPQNFDTLVLKFHELPIDNETKLKRCMELVFEKAVDEPEFSVAYARMCEVLQKKQVMTTDSTGNPQPINFRKLLVGRCQKEFERDYLEGLDTQYKIDLAAAETVEKRKEIMLEFEDKERRARRRSLGNIRFIGELYKLKMLTARIMHECMNKLLGSSDEESLECLCRLLTTVGKELEYETDMKLVDENDQQKQNLKHFDGYFNKMDLIIKSKPISSRVRFMLQDLGDLRRNGWKPRRENAGPKTIDQIHKEAEREKTQQQLMDMKPLGGGGGQRGGDRDGRKRSSRGGQQAANDDGWNTVPVNRPVNRPQPAFEKIDASKIQNLASGVRSKQMDADSMQLGPGNRGWGKGSGSGSRSSQTKQEQSAAPTSSNRFAAFGAAQGADMSSATPPSSEPFDSRRTASRSVGHPGRGSRGPSADNERQRAVQAVKTMNTPVSAAGEQQQQKPTQQSSLGGPPSQTEGQAAGGPSVSTGASADSGRPVPFTLREAQLIVEQSKLLKGMPSVPEELVKKQAKSFLDEFLHNVDEKEAELTVCSTFHPNSMSKVVEEMIKGVLERSIQSRKQIGHLLNRLVNKNILLRPQYEEGLCAVLADAAELVVDVPKLWEYFGELIEPLLEHGTLSIGFLVTCADRSELAMDSLYRGKLASAVLHALAANRGHVEVGEMWRKADMNWNMFVPEEKVASFVASNKLEFTLAPMVPSSNGPMTTLSPDTVRIELTKLLTKYPKQNEEIFDWIDQYVHQTDPIFIRTLMTAVAESTITGGSGRHCGFQKDKMLDRIPLLKRYFDGVLELEKQAIYALQHLMHKLEHPNKALHQIFECLYEGDVISEEAFEAWHDCDNPAEQEGKGVAIKSTTHFFTWLREAASDED